MKTTRDILQWFRELTETFSQTELSEMAGMSQPSVHRAIRGDTGMTLKTYRKVETLWENRVGLGLVVRKPRKRAQKKGE